MSRTSSPRSALLNLDSSQANRGNVWSKANSVLLAVLVIAFALSAPHNVPIGVVGVPAQINGFRSAATGSAVRPFAAPMMPGKQSNTARFTVP